MDRLTPRAVAARTLARAVMPLLRPPLHRGLLAAPLHGNLPQLEFAKDPISRAAGIIGAPSTWLVVAGLIQMSLVVQHQLVCSAGAPDISSSAYASTAHA